MNYSTSTNPFIETYSNSTAHLKLISGVLVQFFSTYRFKTWQTRRIVGSCSFFNFMYSVKFYILSKTLRKIETSSFRNASILPESFSFFSTVQEGIVQYK